MLYQTLISKCKLRWQDSLKIKIYFWRDCMHNHIILSLLSWCFDELYACKHLMSTGIFNTVGRILMRNDKLGMQIDFILFELSSLNSSILIVHSVLLNWEISWFNNQNNRFKNIDNNDIQQRFLYLLFIAPLNSH